MKITILLFLFVGIAVVHTYPLQDRILDSNTSRPHKRRSDYPLDQDCHLCHAVIIESMNRIGNVMSVENTRNVLKSICKTSEFEGQRILNTLYPFRYELKPDEIRTLCDQFVMDNFNQLQIAILQYRIKRPTTSVDDQYCNTPNICPHGWRKSSTESEMVDMEDEL